MAFPISISISPFSFCFYSFILLSSFFLTSFSLSTVSISYTSAQSLVCALTNRSSLRCSSFPFDSIRVPLTDNLRNHTFSGVVSGHGFMCALQSRLDSNSSIILCWRFSVNGTRMLYKRIYQGPEIEELQAGNSRIFGIEKVSKRLRCWQPVSPPPVGSSRSYNSIAVGENFLCGLTNSPGTGSINCEGENKGIIANAPRGDRYIAIAAGSRFACAITFENDVVCWGETQDQTSFSLPRGKFSALALGDNNRSCGLRWPNKTVICFGNNFSLPKSLEEIHFTSIYAKGQIFCGVATKNYTLYCWGNNDFESGVFVPFRAAVLPGPCRERCSSPLPGSESLCTNGFMICQLNNKELGVPETPPSPESTQHLKRKTWSKRNVAFLVVGCVGTFCFLVVVGFFVFKICKRHCGCRVHDSGRLDDVGRTDVPKLEKRLSSLASLGNNGQLVEFSMDELARATEGFSVQFRLGIGSFGSVYHAVLADGRHVAIKRAEVMNPSSCGITMRNRREDKDSAFVNELESLSRLNHRNLVRLLGFYEDAEERVLVYEYMTNGSLADHLHNPRFDPLSWQTRLRIALDAARGIQYLHEFAVPPVIHRDIKSSNILLDAMWVAKVSDFGLSQMGPTEEEDVSHLSLHAAGTLGYIDPEYYRLQQLTTKSDVYSFGVVLLELLSGHKAIHKNEDENPRNVVEYIVPYIMQDELHRVLDKRIPPPTPYEIESVAHVGSLAAECLIPVGRERPSMAEVVGSLEKALASCLAAPKTESISRSTTESSTT